LGVIGHEIARGELEAKGYTPADISYETRMPEVQSHVTPVNLDLIQRRLAIAEGQTGVAVVEEEMALVALGEDGWPVVGSLPPEMLPDTAVSLAASGIEQPVRQLIAANWDMPLLLLTNRYRFLLYTPRRLHEMAAMGVHIADEHRLDRLEVVTAAADWHAIRQCDKLLLVTSLGVVRPYPLSVMLENIEAPVPLRFDNPLLGEVVALFGVSGTEEVVLGTASGKGVRWPLSRVRTIGVQAVNLGTGDDRVTTAVVCQPDDDLLLVTADGYGRVSAANWIETPPKPNQKGKSLIARRSPLVAIVPAGQPAWLVSGSSGYPLQTKGVLREASTKTVPLTELPKGVLGTAVLGGEWHS
jgi:DNA gyrase/topoisomerase IV subunit A